MVAVSSWGKLSSYEHSVVPLHDRAGLAAVIGDTKPGLAHGMGRSYGDSCLNPGGTLWMTRGLDRLVSFDETSGHLVCEAGVLLRDIQRLMVPRGWSLPVTPGTLMVTVGGAIANDVHGKNHHRHGSFGDTVQRIQLVRTDGEVVHCGPQQRPDWFAATVGGLGLTGVIVETEIRLRRIPGPWLVAETTAFTDLDAFFDLADSAESEWEHTVAWIDCASRAPGRGLFMKANPTAENRPFVARRAVTIPKTIPFSLVNRLSLPVFNAAYFRLKQRSSGRRLIHHEAFLYPLDQLMEWNRLYGPRGFFQYQSVVPRAGGRVAIQAMLQAISDSGEGSFLAVLKTFGERTALGLLSFPQPGVTLALDFPNRGQRTLDVLDRLDAIVAEAGGRIYMAKDTRMPRTLFEAGYPRLGEFLQYRDPGISSAMSRRLMGH